MHFRLVLKANILQERTSRVLSHIVLYLLPLTTPSPLSGVACVLAARAVFVVAAGVVRGTALLAARVAPVRYTFQNTPQVIVSCISCEMIVAQ